MELKHDQVPSLEDFGNECAGAQADMSVLSLYMFRQICRSHMACGMIYRFCG